MIPGLQGGISELVYVPVKQTEKKEDLFLFHSIHMKKWNDLDDVITEDAEFEIIPPKQIENK